MAVCKLKVCLFSISVRLSISQLLPGTCTWNTGDTCALASFVQNKAKSPPCALIVQSNAEVGGDFIGGCVAVGATLSDSTPLQTGTINGTAYVNAFQNSNSWSIHGGVKTFSEWPHMWSAYEAIAQTCQFFAFGEYKVHKMRVGGQINNADFVSSGIPYDNGRSLLIFDTYDQVVVTPDVNGKQFGPSILAPFSEVVVQGATGFVDGCIIAKSLKTTGSAQGGLRFHGNCYRGPLCNSVLTTTTTTTTTTRTTTTTTTTRTTTTTTMTTTTTTRTTTTTTMTTTTTTTTRTTTTTTMTTTTTTTTRTTTTTTRTTTTTTTTRTTTTTTMTTTTTTRTTTWTTILVTIATTKTTTTATTTTTTKTTTTTTRTTTTTTMTTTTTTRTTTTTTTTRTTTTTTRTTTTTTTTRTTTTTTMTTTTTTTTRTTTTTTRTTTTTTTTRTTTTTTMTTTTTTTTKTTTTTTRTTTTTTTTTTMTTTTTTANMAFVGWVAAAAAATGAAAVAAPVAAAVIQSMTTTTHAPVLCDATAPCSVVPTTSGYAAKLDTRVLDTRATPEYVMGQELAKKWFQPIIIAFVILCAAVLYLGYKIYLRRSQRRRAPGEQQPTIIPVNETDAERQELLSALE